MKKQLSIIAVVLIVIGALAGYYLFNKPVESPADRTADFTMSSVELAKQYAENEQQADSLYLGKLLQVEGEVLSVEAGETTILTLQGEGFSNVSAEMLTISESEDDLVGSSLTIKGKCTGMLLDVALTNCTIIKD